jgi:hypothetical protein
MTMRNWSLKGDYFENCNCVGLCPCPFGGNPAEGHCDVGFAFHVDEGAFNGVTLDGLNFVAVFYTPGRMPDGNWIGSAYIDEQASSQQREALGQILSGKHGGAFERYMSLTSDFKGIKYVTIEYKAEGTTRSVSIPQVMDFNVEGFVQPGQTEPVHVENMGTWRTGAVTVARGTHSTYVDHGMNWDNTGKVGYYSRFEWP